MRVSIPIVLFAIAASAGAQLPVTHEPGVVVPVDFDGDGKDEFIVLDDALVSHSYTGLFGSTQILPGPSQQLAGELLIDRPVTVDRSVYVATLQLERNQLMIGSYGIQGNGWLVQRTLRIYPALEYPIATVRITPYHRDIDGDGQRDLLVAWTEARSGVSRSHCMVHSPTRSTTPMVVALPPLSSRETRVVALERTASPSLRSDEYLLGLSATGSDAYGGFGFVLLQEGPIQRQGTWFPMLPTLLTGEQSIVTREPMAYGCFSPYPRLGVPIVKTAMGLSARLSVDASEPYVARRGEVLRSTRRGKQLPRCITDYDDDGVQDMVWIDYFENDPTPQLVVADPGPDRRRIFVIPLVTGPGLDPIGVHHGAAGDYDGDGDPDIILSVARGGRLTGSGLVFVRTERDYRRRRTDLRRIW